LVQRQPPQVANLNAINDNGVRLLSIGGTNLSAETRILVDGIVATSRGYDDAGQRLTVLAPSAANGHRAAVVALNPDGQSSLFLTGNNPLTVTLEGSESSFVTSPSSLPAGTESMIEITGVNTNFIDGQVSLGFGVSDVVVRRIWVAGNNRLLANILVSANAPAGLTSITLVSGLQTLPIGSFNILPANTRVLSLSPASAASGSMATVQLRGPSVSGQVAVQLNDRPIAGAALNGNALTFPVPTGLAPGPLPLRVTVGSDTSLPILFVVDPPPPQVIGAAAQLGANIDANRPARLGETIVFSVAGLGDGVSASRVVVNIGGIEHTPQSVQSANGFHQVSVLLSNSVPNGTVPVTVAIDGRASAAFSLVVRASL